MMRRFTPASLWIVTIVVLALGLLGPGWAGSEGRQESAGKPRSDGKSDTTAKDLIQSIRKSAEPIEREISRGAAKAAGILTGKSKEKEKEKP